MKQKEDVIWRQNTTKLQYRFNSKGTETNGKNSIREGSDISHRSDVQTKKPSASAASTFTSTSLRERFLRTNLDVFLIGIFLAVYDVHNVDAVAVAFFPSSHDGDWGRETGAFGEDLGSHGGNSRYDDESDGSESIAIASTYAILFPW